MGSRGRGIAPQPSLHLLGTLTQVKNQILDFVTEKTLRMSQYEDELEFTKTF